MAKGVKTLLLVLGFHIFVQYVEGSKWDQLRVTFGKFSVYPLTSEEATQNGWKWDGHCSDRSSNFFYGKRFVRGNDNATGLIFDCAGSLAGMQATISKSVENPTIYNKPPWIAIDEGHVALTAYFRNPRKICACKGKKCNKPVHNKQPIGNRLWIQMSDFRLKKRVMILPLTKKKIWGTPWVEGTCIPGMGIHYHFNISKDFDCDEALPVFLLFSQQSKTLIGFGWGGSFDVPSAEWEKPPPYLFARSMKPETTPDCLKNYKTVSVQHVYFVDPLKIACT